MYVCMYVCHAQECHASGMRKWVWLRLINLYYLQTDLYYWQIMHCIAHIHCIVAS